MIKVFYQESKRIKNSLKIKTVLKKIIQNHHKKEGEINIIFCNDDFLYKLNMEYLNHNTYTDIITFDNCDDKINGELYISLERVLENSKLHKETFENEIIRVCAHGVLHLLGYKDKEDIDISKMREQENKALKIYKETISRGTIK